mgnify:CR=1 FL=1
MFVTSRRTELTISFVSLLDKGRKCRNLLIFEGLSEVKVRRFYGSTGTLVLAESVTIYFTGRGSFIISMIPLLELRGGLLAASLLKISAAKAIPLCIVGNIIPIYRLFCCFTDRFSRF